MSPETEYLEQVQNLQESLEDIKTREGVIGYILRGSNSAAVDIKDPSKIIDYAALSASVFESGVGMSKMLDLGKIEAIILESAHTKILSLIIGGHRLSIFMEKGVDHTTMLKNLNLTQTG